MARTSSTNSGAIAAAATTAFDVELVDPFFTRKFGLPNTLFITNSSTEKITIRLGGDPRREFRFLQGTTSEVEISDKEQFRSFTVKNEDATNQIEIDELSFSFGVV